MAEPSKKELQEEFDRLELEKEMILLEQEKQEILANQGEGVDPSGSQESPVSSSEMAKEFFGRTGANVLGAEAGAFLGGLGGPAAPITVPVGAILGGMAGDAAFNLISGEEDPLTSTAKETGVAVAEEGGGFAAKKIIGKIPRIGPILEKGADFSGSVIANYFARDLVGDKAEAGSSILETGAGRALGVGLSHMGKLTKGNRASREITAQDVLDDELRGALGTKSSQFKGKIEKRYDPITGQVITSDITRPIDSAVKLAQEDYFQDFIDPNFDADALAMKAARDFDEIKLNISELSQSISQKNAERFGNFSPEDLDPDLVDIEAAIRKTLKYSARGKADKRLIDKAIKDHKSAVVSSPDLKISPLERKRLERQLDEAITIRSDNRYEIEQELASDSPDIQKINELQALNEDQKIRANRIEDMLSKTKGGGRKEVSLEDIQQARIVADGKAVFDRDPAKNLKAQVAREYANGLRQVFDRHALQADPEGFVRFNEAQERYKLFNSFLPLAKSFGDKIQQNLTKKGRRGVGADVGVATLAAVSDFGTAGEFVLANTATKVAGRLFNTPQTPEERLARALWRRRAALNESGGAKSAYDKIAGRTIKISRDWDNIFSSQRGRDVINRLTGYRVTSQAIPEATKNEIITQLSLVSSTNPEIANIFEESQSGLSDEFDGRVFTPRSKAILSEQISRKLKKGKISSIEAAKQFSNLEREGTIPNKVVRVRLPSL